MIRLFFIFHLLDNTKKLLCQTFFKMASTPPEKTLHQRSRSRFLRGPEPRQIEHRNTIHQTSDIIKGNTLIFAAQTYLKACVSCSYVAINLISHDFPPDQSTTAGIPSVDCLHKSQQYYLFSRR